MEAQLVPYQEKAIESRVVVSPREQVLQAAEIANVMNDVVEQQQLFSVIGGKRYLRVEGWQILGSFLNVSAKERYVKRLDDGSYEAYTELVDVNTGVIIGGASATCGMDEVWGKRPEYARRSMAITRSVGKAYRLSNKSWIVTLKGYECTSAEEMPNEKEDKKITEVKEVIYTGTPDQQRGIAALLKKANIAEDNWGKVNDKMLNRAYTKTNINAVIAELSV
jgi:hypothetical protein